METVLQAPPERRLVFKDELQRVGTEGAKVLRELGNKVKMMFKLSPEDILFEVHAAAEELQKKIDQQSYLLINSECWEVAKQAEAIENAKAVPNTIQDESKHVSTNSLSETVLNLGSAEISKSGDFRNANMGSNPHLPLEGSLETKFQKLASWPSRKSFNMDAAYGVDESKTFESASALSLATFASLLIEFVARLENVVNSFEELSVKANFKEPIVEPGVETVGLWTRLSRRLRSRD